MKKTFIAILAAATMLASSCSGLGGLTNTSSTSGILTNVLGGLLGQVLLGGGGLSASALVGNWQYAGPSAAFTSEQALNSAGGVNAANSLITSLAPSYNSIGITKKNTSFNFGDNNTFSAQVNGIPFSGTYAYNEQTGKIALKTGQHTLNGDVIKTNNGIGLMFDAKQMTAMLQQVGKVSDKAAIEAVGKLARSADGARVGFELTH